MRALVVNADDFGQSPGVNRGIIIAHEHGILTSASLMVRWPAAADAAAYAIAHPPLSVGLHLDLGEWYGREGDWHARYEVVDMNDPVAVRAEVTRQLTACITMLGRDPTHIDSHQHMHMREHVRPVVLEAADRLGIPVRACSPRIQYAGGFYGQTETGEPLHDRLTVAGLQRVLAELGPGDHELGCHPADAADLDTTYGEERLLELAVLCDKTVPALVREAGFDLISFAELNAR